MYNTLKSILLTLLLTSISVFAQKNDDNNSRTEGFIGYTYQSIGREKPNEIEVFDGVNAPIPEFTEDDFRNTFGAATKLNGITTSGTYYITQAFGITGEFSYSTGNESRDIRQITTVPGNTVRIRRTKYDFMIGLQYKFRNKSRFEPFIRALAGATRQKNRSRFFGGNSLIDELQDNFTALSTSFGGGVDYRINRRLAIRLGQIEYNPTFPNRRNLYLGSSFSEDETIFRSSRRDSFKFSVGVVFR
jgi:opacity protein-like surface antigen